MDEKAKKNPGKKRSRPSLRHPTHRDILKGENNMNIPLSDECAFRAAQREYDNRSEEHYDGKNDEMMNHINENEFDESNYIGE